VFLLGPYRLGVEVQLILQLLNLFLIRGDLVIFTLQVSQECFVPHID
jgi:hypothetical protein